MILAAVADLHTIDTFSSMSRASAFHVWGPQLLNRRGHGSLVITGRPPQKCMFPSLPVLLGLNLHRLSFAPVNVRYLLPVRLTDIRYTRRVWVPVRLLKEIPFLSTSGSLTGIRWKNYGPLLLRDSRHMGGVAGAAPDIDSLIGFVQANATTGRAAPNELHDNSPSRMHIPTQPHGPPVGPLTSPEPDASALSGRSQLSDEPLRTAEVTL